eukprot:2864420-Rhodomonas_salina.1
MDIITDGGQAITDHIQSQYDSLKSAAISSAKPKIKTKISEFSDDELKKIMSKARHGDIIQRVAITRIAHLNRHLTKEWNSTKTFGLTDDKAGKKNLEQIHKIAYDKLITKQNQNFMVMTQRAWT